jgi:type I restriction enzyme R subunit
MPFVEFLRADGSSAGAPARVLDFDASHNNDWPSVNQVAVGQGPHVRRPDVERVVGDVTQCRR